MPIPGLSDIHEFSGWLKTPYVGNGRRTFRVEPVQGGLIMVSYDVEIPQCICINPFDRKPGSHHSLSCPRHRAEPHAVGGKL